MRVLITGATGLIGRALGKSLAARGDTLVCLVRDVDGAARRLPFPATCFAWDHTRPVPPQALADIDAIVNLAGEPVADRRWSGAQKDLIRDSRVAGTRQLVDAVVAHGASVRTFVQGSAIGFYGDRADETLHAGSAKGRGFLADVVDAWESQLRPLAERRPDVRMAVVRTGVVLARHGGALAKMLPLFRGSAGGRLGSGRQWMSWIHVDDIVALFAHALDSSAAGVLEGVAPQAATNRDFTNSLCRSLRVLQNAPVPPLAIRALYGEMGGVLLESAKIEPRRTIASGFRFRFESIDATLNDLAAPLQGSTREKVSEQWLPRRPEDVWPFFCDERNLEELTPGFLHFEVLGKSTPEIGEGTLIDYRLKLNGVPIGWQSRIENWEPARRFVDTQVKGPYASWKHTHEFVPVANGTLLRDVVRYRLPFGWLGSVVAGCPVESQVDRIFSHRAARIAERFAH
ncbi:MAG: TIGR01777 family oxidoreductase [Burkholderiales bacterium]